MKILLIHTNYTQAGGEDAVVLQEMELLQQQHEVEILYFQNQAGLKGALQFLCSIWNVNTGSVVRKKIKAFQPDVVHLHNWHFASGPLIIRIVKKMGVPLVHTLHNYRLICPSAILLHNNQLFLDSLQQPFPWSAIKKGVYRNSILQTFWLSTVVWFHKKIGSFKRIDTYICLTEFSRKLLQESDLAIDPQKIVVKPNFTKIVRQPNSITRSTHFLFIGRLSTEKGIEVLLTAFEFSNIQLKIAGDGPLKELVLQKSKENANITYLGMLTEEKVNTELSMTQALIVSSICYEGMPMTILEAFSNKTPVIAANLGAMSTMVEHNKNGLHFEDSNAADLKEKIDDWVKLPETEKEAMRNNSFNSYQSLYAPEQQMAYFEAIYKQAIANCYSE